MIVDQHPPLPGKTDLPRDKMSGPVVMTYPENAGKKDESTGSSNIAEDTPPPEYEDIMTSPPQPPMASSFPPSTSSPTTSNPTFSSPPTSSSSLTTSTPAVVDGRAVNYIAISKSFGDITCTYTLDPSIQLPASFMPKLKNGRREEDRSNLSLKTKVGSIFACVILQHRQNSDKRTMLEFKVTLGMIVVKVDTTPSTSLPTPRPPFQLKAAIQSGNIVLHLPRNFNGFITINSTLPNVLLSPEIARANRWISTTGRVRKGFIGDASRLDGEVGEWKGDEVVIEGTVVGVEIGFVVESEAVRWR
ncbi:hypothetical protein AAF712_009165 [Marasmius tenuissimus]|uniref:DUF7330 domain-containing protein n=1 Tax=Marasmius tenuissimus TaxID=585030 RepID=A0ABR2ZS85_9AGAR